MGVLGRVNTLIANDRVLRWLEMLCRELGRADL
jgi:hypothetical protein